MFPSIGSWNTSNNDRCMMKDTPSMTYFVSSFKSSSSSKPANRKKKNKNSSPASALQNDQVDITKIKSRRNRKKRYSEEEIKEMWRKIAEKPDCPNCETSRIIVSLILKPTHT